MCNKNNILINLYKYGLYKISILYLSRLIDDETTYKKTIFDTITDTES